MSKLDPEERVLTECSSDEFINYCDSCCAMEYQPHCTICSCPEYFNEVSVFDENTISVLLDSYYSCLVTSERLKNMEG